MKHLLLLAAPLVLAACGPGVSDAGGDTMPAPTPIAESDSGKKEAKAEKKPEIQVTEVEGSWVQSDGPEGQRVEYSSEDGAINVSLTCQEPAAFDGDAANVLVLRRTYTAADAPGSIGILTSAGNGAITAEVNTEANELRGVFDTRSQAANALANGEGDIRFVAAQSAYAIQTDPMVETLIENCRPPIEVQLEGSEAGESGEAENTEEDDEPRG